MTAAPIFARAGRALAGLGDRPARLACAAVLVSHVFAPYEGFYHDAMQYGGQVLNRATGGGLADDLFFRYGSQDRFSVFSVVLAPVAAVVGFPVTFAAGYFASGWLFAFGLGRLLRELFADPVVTAVGVFVAVTAPVPYGGGGIFTVPESFLTPRLPATGFALLGLAFTLQARAWPAVGCLAAAVATHPLIGFGPAVMAVGTVAVRRLGWVPAFLLAGLGTLGVCVLVAVEPLGLRVFGPLDPVWKQTIGRMTNYNFVSAWTGIDWVRLAFAAAACVLAARAYPDRPGTAAFFAAAVVVGGLGLATFAAAGGLPYALLLQGQGYRAVWVAQALALPAVVGVAAAWWPRGPLDRFCAVALLAFAAEVQVFDANRTAIVGLAFALCVVRIRGLGATPTDPDWGWKSLAVAAVGVYVVWNLQVYAVAPEAFRTTLRDTEWPRLVGIGFRTAGITVRVLVVGLVLAAAAGVIARRPRAVAVGCVGLAAAIQTAYTVPAEYPPARAVAFPIEKHERFVIDFLRSDAAGVPPGRRPTVQWGSPVTLWTVWHRAGANAYFHPFQASGVIYSEATAKEAARRADRTARFTIDELRRDSPPRSPDDPPAPPGPPTADEVLYGGRLTDREPTARDLYDLAADPVLDFIIIRRAFPGLYAATDGTWYIYDARALRAAAPRFAAPGIPAPGPRP